MLQNSAHQPYAKLGRAPFLVLIDPVTVWELVRGERDKALARRLGLDRLSASAYYGCAQWRPWRGLLLHQQE
jgi:hypothetical protein